MILPVMFHQIEFCDPTGNVSSNRILLEESDMTDDD